MRKDPNNKDWQVWQVSNNYPYSLNSYNYILSTVHQIVKIMLQFMFFL